MAAYTLDRFGDLDGLVRHEQDELTPGPTEVLLRLYARSLNYRDLLILNGQYPVPAREGVVALSDGAGEVTAIGSAVTKFEIGDRVTATYFPRWTDGSFTMPLAMEQFGCTRDGMLAEFVLADEHALVRIPGHLSFEQAATLPCAALTAWSALTGPRRLLAGETVLTIGTGGVAMFALQFAKLHGARVLALTSSPDKEKLLRQHGADEVVNRLEHGDWETTVRELTDGRGVDHVVETGNAETLPRSLMSCADEGEVALAAALGLANLSTTALSGAITLRRYYVGSRTNFEAMNAAIAHHELIPVIDTVFAFDDARQAYEHYAARRHVGKIVIGA